jgi:UDP-N-acetylmuramoylalanine--D-glutamate ligase
MEFAGQNVLVLGLGVSGRSAARFCAERGAKVIAADERPLESIPDFDAMPDEIDCRFGAPFPDLEPFDLVVPSPGIPAARWSGRARRAWGDIELCYRALPIPVVAVTGTNGKSTVVRLIEALAQAAGLRAHAAGNLGIPALDLVGQPLDLAILEVSSFQLESVDSFRPRTAVLLNVTPDHLDRHADLDGYLAAKARIFARQTVSDHAILNGDDPRVREMRLPDAVERLEFRRRDPVAAGAWFEGRHAIVQRGGRRQVVDLGGVSPHLVHQQENVLAALLAVATLDVDLTRASRGLVDFQGLPHRCERVAEIRGVEFIDDSKATNVGAAVRSLAAIEAPIIWIAGGRHKGGDLGELADAARGRIRRALLIGEAAEEFERTLAEQVGCERVADLAAAVARAMAIAHPGDVVLLAPACASFDQFKNFEDRGRQFQAAVHALAGDRGER